MLALASNDDEDSFEEKYLVHVLDVFFLNDYMFCRKRQVEESIEEFYPEGIVWSICMSTRLFNSKNITCKKTNSKDEI